MRMPKLYTPVDDLSQSWKNAHKHFSTLPTSSWVIQMLHYTMDSSVKEVKACLDKLEKRHKRSVVKEMQTIWMRAHKRRCTWTEGSDKPCRKESSKNDVGKMYMREQKKNRMLLSDYLDKVNNEIRLMGELEKVKTEWKVAETDHKEQSKKLKKKHEGEIKEHKKKHEGEIKEHKKKHEGEIKEHEKKHEGEIKDYRNTIKKRDEEKEILERELKDTSEKLKIVIIESKEKESRLQKQQEEYKKLKNENTEKDSRIAKQKEILKTVKQMLDEEKKEKEKVMGENESYQKKLKEKDESFQKKLEEKDDSYAEALEQILSLHEEVKESGEKVTEAQQKLDEEKLMLSTKVKEQEQKIAKLSGLAEELKGENGKLREDSEKKQAVLDNYEKTIQATERVAKQLTAIMQNHTDENMKIGVETAQSSGTTTITNSQDQERDSVDSDEELLNESRILGDITQEGNVTHF